MLDICLLGTGGMLPLPDRFLTAMLARHNGRKLLIDCGEGTQVTMKTLGWGYKTLDTICFTHYHGDHVTGLPGLLLTIGNSGRTEPLTMIGPPGLKKVVEGLLIVAQDLSFDIVLKELSYEAQTLQSGEFTISVTPVDHRIPCFAYNIEIKRQPKFLVEKARQHNIPQQYWNRLQHGETIITDRVVYEPGMVQGEERKGIKVGYCTDARPSDEIIALVKDADLFICEGMYGSLENQDQVKKYKHMTYMEAATLAQKASVKELWLTHFSPANTNPEEGLENAQKIFRKTKIGYDRMTRTFLFE